MPTLEAVALCAVPQCWPHNSLLVLFLTVRCINEYLLLNYNLITKNFNCKTWFVSCFKMGRIFILYFRAWACNGYLILVFLFLNKVWETKKVCKNSAIVLKQEIDVVFQEDKVMILAVDDVRRLQVSIL